MTAAARLRIESEYFNYLKRVTNEINRIVKRTYDPKRAAQINDLVYELDKYAGTLGEWAERLAKRIIDRVNRYNLKDWMQISATMGDAFRKSYHIGDPVFERAMLLQTSEVTLIKSLPLESAVRAQKMSVEYVTKGWRHEELAEQIMATSEVAKSRAACIARTEVAKANSYLTQSRCESVGIKKYIWRTAEDANVRESHAVLDGSIFEFANPPYIAGEGNHGPGDFPNCRCWAEPIIEGIE